MYFSQNCSKIQSFKNSKFPNLQFKFLNGIFDYASLYHIDYKYYNTIIFCIRRVDWWTGIDHVVSGPCLDQSPKYFFWRWFLSPKPFWYVVNLSDGPQILHSSIPIDEWYVPVRPLLRSIWKERMSNTNIKTIVSQRGFVLPVSWFVSAQFNVRSLMPVA